MPINAPVTRAVDLKPLREGLRTALLADTAITAVVGTRVKRDMDVTGNTFPYIAVSIPASVPLNTQSSTGISALVDAQCVDLGTAANGDAVAPEIAKVLLDTGFAVAGYDVLDVERVADISRSAVIESKAYYYAGVRVRVRLRKH